MNPQVYTNRLLRLLRLDTTVFEEMRDDPEAMWPAVVIAAVSFLLAGLGGWLWWLTQGFGDKGKVFLESLVLGSLFATGLWLAWIGVAYLVLVYFFHYATNFTRMVRACGLAAVPMAFSVLMFIPGINLAVGIAAIALFFLLMDIGLQVSVDALPGHVVFANFAGLLLFAVVLSVFTQRGDYFAPGVFLFRSPASALSDLANAAGSFLPPRLR